MPKLISTLSALFLLVIFSGCKKDSENESNDDCICTMIYAPVCGSDGNTYENDCFAECNGIKDYEQGEC